MGQLPWVTDPNFYYWGKLKMTRRMRKRNRHKANAIVNMLTIAGLFIGMTATAVAVPNKLGGVGVGMTAQATPNMSVVEIVESEDAKSVSDESYTLMDTSIYNKEATGYASIEAMEMYEDIETDAEVENLEYHVLTMDSIVYSEAPEIVKYEHDYRGDRSNAIMEKRNKFVDSKTLTKNDIYCIEPEYTEDNKMIIRSRAEAMCLDTREISNWTADDFYKVVNEEMYNLVPVAIQMEKELGVNAIYIMAIGINETGWGKHMAGRNNYFNWTNDGIRHFNYDDANEFAADTIERYGKYYTSEEYFTKSVGFEPECLTLEVVNTKYAVHLGGGTNWDWSNVIAEVMAMLSTRLYE